MRRMEAKNYRGAARLIREKNPLGEVCGLVCTPGRTCQKDCYRGEFAGVAVRIAELQHWVCTEAGEEGWIKPDRHLGFENSRSGDGLRVELRILPALAGYSCYCSRTNLNYSGRNTV
jgi:hypothetical protein